MDWNQVQAIGSLLSALATFSAAMIALYLGLRKPAKRLSIETYFYEKSQIDCGAIAPDHLVTVSNLNERGDDDRLLGFETRNACSEIIVLVGFIEQAQFNRPFSAIRQRLSKGKGKKIAVRVRDGYITTYRRYGEYLYCFGSPVSLEPGSHYLFCVDYDYIKAVQMDREKAGLFDLTKPLAFYAVDIDGKRYPVSSDIPAENFYKELTCRMEKVHWLD